MTDILDDDDMQGVIAEPLARALGDRYLTYALSTIMHRALPDARDGLKPMVIDPTRGSVLGLLAKVPSLQERLMQGRAIGFVIIGLGMLGLLLALERSVVLHRE